MAKSEKSKRERRTFSKESRYYVDKDEYNEELIKYVETGTASERLGEIFDIHVKRFSSAGNFKNYTYRDEMEANALWFLLKYSTRFNAEKQLKEGKKPNAFSYCTTIIYRAFLQTIQKEKKHSKLKDSLIKNFPKINHELLKYQESD